MGVPCRELFAKPRSYSCEVWSDENRFEAIRGEHSLDCWCNDLDRCMCAEENDEDSKIGFHVVSRYGTNIILW